MRQSLGQYALSEGIVRRLDDPTIGTVEGRREWLCMVASHAMSDGCTLVESGSDASLSESEACDLIRAGRVVEVVS